MRTLRLAGLLLAAACGSVAPAATSTQPALSADLFPCGARTAPFVMARGEARSLRVEPTADGAVLWFEGDGVEPRRMDVSRAGGGYVFSGGPDAQTELLRFGAAPGSTWRSGDTDVHFDGWERIDVPGGTFDAVRIRAVSGPADLPVVQTWWFAPGTGLVRLRSDRGGMFSEEMLLAGAR